MSLLAPAKALAERAHAGQVDKAGRPYIEHVARVAAAVADDVDAEIVAWLHDVMEDQPVFTPHVRTLLPIFLLANVYALTRSTESDDAYYGLIRQLPIALRVKLADIADNADEERLALLDPKTASRLRAKYRKALALLTGGYSGESDPSAS